MEPVGKMHLAFTERCSVPNVILKAADLMKVTATTCKDLAEE